MAQLINVLIPTSQAMPMGTAAWNMTCNVDTNFGRIKMRARRANRAQKGAKEALCGHDED